MKTNIKTKYITPGITFTDDNNPTEKDKTSKSQKSVKPNRSLYYSPSSITSSDTTKLDRDLVKNESGGDYGAFNAAGGGEGAVGKYQFRWKLHKDKIRKFAGNDKLTAQQFMDNPKLQDDFYKKSWKPVYLYPDVNKVRSAVNTQLSDDQLAKLVHFRGRKGAIDYLKGRVSNKPENYNMSISKYIGTNKKALGGVLSAFGSVAAPLGQMIEGDGTNPLASGASGLLTGGLIGGIAKTAQAIKAKKLKEKNDKMNTNNFNSMVAGDSQAAYSSYLPTKTGGFYAMGGQPQQQQPQPEVYEAEKNEVVMGDPLLEDSKQLSEGIHKVGGKTHEEGGTMGSGGDFIFSNSILINDSIKEVLTGMKLPVTSKMTYAEAAEKLGKYKKKFDTTSNNYRKINTSKAMTARIMKSLEMLAQSQEELKQSQGVKRLGGKIKKYIGGGTPPNYFMSEFPNFIDNPGTKKYFPKADKYATMIGMNRSNPMQVDKTSQYLKTHPEKLPYPSFPSKGDSGEPKEKEDTSGLLSSTAGLLSDSITANRLQDEIVPRIPSKARLNYVDRSGYGIANNNATMNNYLTTRNGSPKNQQAVYAQTLKANNQVNLNEAQRQDQAVQQFTNRNVAIESDIVNQYNKTAYINNQLKNNKTEAVGGAFTNYLGNLNTVRAEKSAKDLDKEKLKILRERSKLRPGLMTDDLWKKITD